MSEAIRKLRKAGNQVQIKKPFCVHVKCVRHNDWGEQQVMFENNVWESAFDEESAVKLARRKLIRAGFNIAKDNTWTDLNANTEDVYHFKCIDTRDDERKEFEEAYKESLRIQRELVVPDYYELEDIITDEGDLREAQSLYEWEDEDWHLPDMNKEDLKSILDKYN